jgi:hypothetical protein
VSTSGLLPIIKALSGWLCEHYDPGFDPVDDEKAAIRVRALLILDQLEMLRAQVQRHQMGIKNE